MSKTIRTYSTEFKQDAIEYMETHPELTIKDVAQYKCQYVYAQKFPYKYA